MAKISRNDIKKFLRTSTKNSSVHGFKYLLNKRVNIYGRIVWFIFVLIGILGLLGILYESIIKEQNSAKFQLKNIMETPLYSVYRIYFPSVTVCNYNRINWKRINEAMNIFLPNESNKAVRNAFLQYIILHESYEVMLNSNDFDNYFKIIKENHNDNDLNNILFKLNKVNFTKVFDFLSFKCEEIFQTCWWRFRNITCCNYFYKLKTLNGFCWSFNSQYHRDKFLYENPEPKYPWRSANGGRRTGLFITLKLSNNTHRPEFNQERGIMLIVGDPYEIPARGQIILANQAGHFMISPTEYQTVQEARTISPKYRQCVFARDSHNETYYTLPYTIYRHSNCIAECKRRYLFEKCGCVYGIFWPVGNASECNISQMKCIGKNLDSVNLFRRDGEWNRQNISGPDIAIVCHCMYSCNFIHYDADVRFSDRERVESSPDYDIVEADIFYHRKVMVKYNNQIVWTWLDLFVNIGGLASLFLGCSFISAFEIFYFTITGIVLCFKLCCNRRIS